MADSPQPWSTLLLFFLLSLQILALCSASPQNLETFFPATLPPPPPPPQVPDSPPLIPESPPQIPVAPATPPPDSPPGNGNKIAKAVAATAASTLVVTGLAFALFIVAKRRRREKTAGAGNVNGGGGVDGGGGGGAGRPLPLQSRSNFVRYQGDVKGIIVDENGLDVLYWRKLERSRNGDLRKEVLRKKEVVQEVPLLRGRSSSSHVKVLPFDDEDQDHEVHEDLYASNSVQRMQQGRRPNGVVFKPVRDSPELDSPSSRSSMASGHHEALYSSSSTARQQSRRTNGNVFKAVRESPELDSPSSRSSTASCPPPPSAPSTPPPRPPLAPPLPPAATAFLSVPKKLAAPTPIPAKKTVVPIPAPPPVMRSSNAVAKPPPPPPPPAMRSVNAVAKPPPPPPVLKEKEAEKAPSGAGTSGGDDGRVIMKPLHWDKVNRVNADHSMVWDKVNGGSFRFDGDLMEALFGYVATNKKSPTGNNKEQSNEQTGSNPSRTYILDTRKSQNIAIILKSLYVSRKEVIDALMEGIGLSQETLEKLSRIAPTPEEQSLILEYDADPARLADAERFLFHVLKAVPSAFTRLNAMLFRATCGSEITQLKDSVQTLELACSELRTRGLFVKLLEAILKSGNRMNAGTSRGNAQAFNLTSLRKLSDVKSTDGKTTLLHFVVEEVVRFEGKRCVLNRSRSSNRSSPSSSMKEDREKEYLTLGLPIVGGLSSEFSNVKKAASVDYDVVSSTCSVLSARAAEIRRMIVSQSVKGGFAKEMESFLDSIEDELRKADRERARVLDLVIKTTEYYQAGASKDKEAHPFQLFVIVKDFLIMVDQVCVEIARTMQRKTRANGVSASSANAPTRPEKFAMRFPNLPKNFMSDKSSSDESDDDE